MKMNAKTGARAKILAYVARNGLSTLPEIMAGIGEPVRVKALDNVKLAVSDDLLKSRRDDVTNQPGYEITDAGRAWLKKNGKPEAATTPAPEEAKPAAPTVSQAAPAPTPPAPAKPAAKTPAKPAAKAAPAKLPKPKAAAAAVYAAIQDPEQITAPIDPAEQLRQALAENMALSQTIVEICCAIGRDPGQTTTSELSQALRDYINAQIEREKAELNGIISDIRAAIGDNTGRITLGDLAEHIENERKHLISDRRYFVGHFDAIRPITEELLSGYIKATSPAEAVRIMDQLIDTQHAHIHAQAVQIETLTNKLEIAAQAHQNQEQQIAELRARVAAQIQAGHESASSANRLLTEVHEVLSNGWPAGIEAPQGCTTLQLANQIAADFAAMCKYAKAAQHPTPDAYLVTRHIRAGRGKTVVDTDGPTRHKSIDTATRKALAAIRGGYVRAEIHATNLVAVATFGAEIKPV